MWQAAKPIFLPAGKPKDGIWEFASTPGRGQEKRSPARAGVDDDTENRLQRCRISALIMSNRDELIVY